MAASILIDYYRKTDKSNSIWVALIPGYKFAISAITKYEIYSDATPGLLNSSQKILSKVSDNKETAVTAASFDKVESKKLFCACFTESYTICFPGLNTYN